MFKSAQLYRIDQWQPPTQAEIENRLGQSRFVACGASQPESMGWLEPRGQAHGALMESVAGQLILLLGAESKAVPSSAVKAEVEAKLDQIEKETGRRPKGKRAKELKEEVVHSLLPRAFPKRSSTWVWLDLEGGWCVLGVASAKRGDVVMTRLRELLGPGVVLTPAQTALSPSVAMAQWLGEREGPAGFSIDRECELKQPDSEKASVRYTRHNLDIEEIAEHLKQGKQPTQLAMTWAGRVSFVLTESGALKKIKLLDVVLEGREKASGPGAKDENFEADVALTTGELRQLLPELAEGLGGLQPFGTVQAAPAPATGATATSEAPAAAAPVAPAGAGDDTPPWA
ncbi:MAG: recombination-associated protein RdgC [Rubrivivax sp.]|jgi:recombination associated protein RdgC